MLKLTNNNNDDNNNNNNHFMAIIQVNLRYPASLHHFRNSRTKSTNIDLDIVSFRQIRNRTVAEMPYMQLVVGCFELISFAGQFLLQS